MTGATNEAHVTPMSKAFEKEFVDAFVAKTKGITVKGGIYHRPMNKILGIDDNDDDGDVAREITVVSNDDGIFGALAICNPELLNWAIGKYGKQFFIIPSSVHEVLVTAWDDDMIKDIEKSIYSINREEVGEPDRLSDDLFGWYNGKLIDVSKEYVK